MAGRRRREAARWPDRDPGRGRFLSMDSDFARCNLVFYVGGPGLQEFLPLAYVLAYHVHNMTSLPARPLGTAQRPLSNQRLARLENCPPIPCGVVA